MDNTNVYLYAVIPRSQDGAYTLQGVQGLPVSLFSQDDLSAAISIGPVDAGLPDPQAHRRVMRQLLNHAAVFPAPEPTILPDRRSVQELLIKHQGRMLNQLRRVQGFIEVRLQVFNRCAADSPGKSRGAASSSVSTSADAAQSTAMAQEVAAERAYLWAQHARALRSGGFIVQSLPLPHAQAMLRLACLLPRASLELFMLNCKSLGRHLDPRYEFSVSEPMAPVDFVDPQLFASPQFPDVARAGTPAAGIPLPRIVANPTHQYPLRS